MSRAYGETMGEYFAPRQEPLLVHSASLASHVAVTHIRCDGPGTGITDPIPAEPALLLAIQMRPLIKHDVWLDGRGVKVAPYATGALTMLDLRTRPVANLASSYECVQMYFPQTALHEIADAEDTARLRDLPTLNGVHDPVLAHLAHIARAAVSPTGPATSLFLESMLLVVHRHLRTNYSGQTKRQTNTRGGLAPWQESRVKEYMEAHLDTNISLLELAAQCQLSPSHFGRAFKTSTGVPPHRWLVGRRIARVRQLLGRSDNSLAEIAQLCGFADQSHMAREFRRAEGLSLTAWRRENMTAYP
jgi:AraC family transcriptional regulator